MLFDPTKTEDNPWTTEEKLWVLKIFGSQTHGGTAPKNVKMLHQQMEKVCNRKKEPQKPMRTEYEWVSKLRELQNEGVTIEDLEEVLKPKQETPRKKRKKASK